MCSYTIFSIESITEKVDCRAVEYIVQLMILEGILGFQMTHARGDAAQYPDESVRSSFTEIMTRSLELTILERIAFLFYPHQRRCSKSGLWRRRETCNRSDPSLRHDRGSRSQSSVKVWSLGASFGENCCRLGGTCKDSISSGTTG